MRSEKQPKLLFAVQSASVETTHNSATIATAAYIFNDIVKKKKCDQRREREKGN